MRSFKTFAMVTLTVLSLSAGAFAQTGSAARSYSAAQVEQIMQMRDNGDGLADVARVVGGTREDVKAAEASEKASRKAARTAASLAVAAR